MQSLRSRIIISLIKHRHLFRFSLKRDVVDQSFSVADFRGSVDKASEMMNRRIKDARISNLDIEGMHAEWLDADGTVEKKVLLYIHGGGFISGSCRTHRTHVLKFVRSTGVKALLFDYRLAPEHPFPAALDDCLTVYKWLLSSGYKSSDIVVAGESAGATLVLSLLNALKKYNLSQPAGAVSISPVTDLSCCADSFKRNAKKDIAPLGSMNIWTSMYYGAENPDHPLVSPVRGELEGLPSTCLVVGTNEIHFDDVIGYYNKRIKAGSEAELHCYKGMVHAFPIMAPLFPEAVKALKCISRYIRKTLDLPE